MTRVVSLLDAGLARLDEARVASDGRSSVSLHDGEPCVLRQTVTGIVTGQHMVLEHPPEEAWLLVLEGSLTLASGADGSRRVVEAGDLLELPRSAHVLTASRDTVFLLTVAMGDRPVERSRRRQEDADVRTTGRRP